MNLSVINPWKPWKIVFGIPPKNTFSYSLPGLGAKKKPFREAGRLVPSLVFPGIFSRKISGNQNGRNHQYQSTQEQNTQKFDTKIQMFTWSRLRALDPEVGKISHQIHAWHISVYWYLYNTYLGFLIVNLGRYIILFDNDHAILSGYRPCTCHLRFHHIPENHCILYTKISQQLWKLIEKMQI